MCRHLQLESQVHYRLYESPVSEVWLLSSQSFDENMVSLWFSWTSVIPCTCKTMLLLTESYGLIIAELDSGSNRWWVPRKKKETIHLFFRCTYFYFYYIYIYIYFYFWIDAEASLCFKKKNSVQFYVFIAGVSQKVSTLRWQNQKDDNIKNHFFHFLQKNI